ncbi:hypothetical protein [Embleya sp. NPDC020886]|uniref:hypothetical protein n=1 Tax=Embleya sp. NPDC020886 TaxID=3363980 RepID=UPI00378AEDD1
MRLRTSLGTAFAAATLVLGTGAVTAHAAPSGDEIEYEVVDEATGQTTTGTATPSPLPALAPTAKASGCSGESFSGRRATITCNYPNWYGYLGCSNGNFYRSPNKHGKATIRFVCPPNTTARSIAIYTY